MDAISYVRILAGRWRIVALTCFIGLLAGWITTPGAEGSRTSGFRATHILMVDGGGGTGGAGGAGTQAGGSRTQVGPNVGLAQLLVTTGDVPVRAAAELDTDVTTLLAKVVTNSDPTVGTLSITAFDAEATRAEEIADTVATELLAELTEDAQERYTADLEEAEAAYADLEAQVAELPPITSSGRDDVAQAARAPLLARFEAAGQRLQDLLSQGPPSAGFVTLQPATAGPAGGGAAAARSSTRQSESGRRGGASQDEAPAAPAVSAGEVEGAPDRTTRMLIGGAVGLLLGIGLALLRERLDPRLRTREDAERAFGLPVLAEVPHLDRSQRRRPEIATVDNGRALEAEAYRVLATSLLFQHSSALGPDRDGARDGHGDSGSGGLIQTSDDVRRAAHGGPLLGWVPAPATWTALNHRTQPNTPAAEAYRWLAIALRAGNSDGPTRTLLITSATAGEDITATTANLGVALAREGQRVVVIDGDPSQPRLHAFFDLPNTVGLSSVVAGEVSLSVAAKPVTGADGLSIVAAGPLPPDPPEFLASPRVGEVLGALAGTVDIVILKVAPIPTARNASVLADRVDGTILVATAGTTTGQHLREAVGGLEGAGATMLGVVLSEPAGDTRRSQNGAGPSPAPAGHGDVVLVTSPGAKEGKSSVSVNLAAALAEAGRSVLALDFDLRRPRLDQFFGVEAHQRGLTDVLALSGRGPRLEEVVRPTPVPDVRVALSGSAVTNPSELLPGARPLVSKARSLAEVIVIDTPPVLVASDAVQLLPATDAVVVVCRTGTTRATEAARARQLLARLDGPVLGLVLLGVQPSSGARSYYYDHARPRFWWRSRTPGPASGRPGRDDGPRTARTASGEASDNGAMGKLGAKVNAKSAGSTKATVSPKAPRPKKANQRSSK